MISLPLKSQPVVFWSRPFADQAVIIVIGTYFIASRPKVAYKQQCASTRPAQYHRANLGSDQQTCEEDTEADR